MLIRVRKKESGKLTITKLFFKKQEIVLSLPFEIIRGFDLLWKNGTILSSGAEQPSLNAIRSGFVPAANLKLKFFGREKTENNIIYLVFVAEYGANKNFLRRKSLRDSNGNNYTVNLGNDCAYIRLVYGHANATNTRTTTSEGKLCNIKCINR